MSLCCVRKDKLEHQSPNTGKTDRIVTAEGWLIYWTSHTLQRGLCFSVWRCHAHVLALHVEEAGEQDEATMSRASHRESEQLVLHSKSTW